MRPMRPVSQATRAPRGHSHFRLAGAWFTCAAVGGLFLQLHAAHAAETNAEPQSSSNGPRREFSAFRLITERNIFNPHRSEPGESRRTESRGPERRVHRDSFSLLGTMSYEKGRFAFFDGSNSDYRKVLQPAESIAGFKIAAVAPTCVKLETTNGQVIDLCVGMQLSKQEEEDWRLSEPAAASTNSSTSETGTNGGASDDVIKRLLQRREQEGVVNALEAAPAPIPIPTPAADPNAPAASPSSGEADDVVKRLLQKREQELNK
ncbi:MAG TPA: hypothetical protein VNU68_09015 [Verrucomicrobiae bacterium]|nr:hypothetical protein [Verrucomicrobiae bacterium]